MADSTVYHPLGYESVYLPFCKVADTPSHIQGDNIYLLNNHWYSHYLRHCNFIIFNLNILLKNKTFIHKNIFFITFMTKSSKLNDI